jgi:hypothetical protein
MANEAAATNAIKILRNMFVSPDWNELQKRYDAGFPKTFRCYRGLSYFFAAKTAQLSATDEKRAPIMRKLIAFDDDTLDKLTQLGRDRMGTLQELADEAFADLLRKYGIPVDLRDALRKSASLSRANEKTAPDRAERATSKPARSRSARARPARRTKDQSG